MVMQLENFEGIHHRIRISSDAPTPGAHHLGSRDGNETAVRRAASDRGNMLFF